ncbi:unnamed protein product [Amoebophrya sp. A25]|nr:unnamed protein product [Amoebophrya sp. A25]|eukprot:GSA25T00021164001.1
MSSSVREENNTTNMLLVPTTSNNKMKDPFSEQDLNKNSRYNFIDPPPQPTDDAEQDSSSDEEPATGFIPGVGDASRNRRDQSGFCAQRTHCFSERWSVVEVDGKVDVDALWPQEFDPRPFLSGDVGTTTGGTRTLLGGGGGNSYKTAGGAGGASTKGGSSRLMDRFLKKRNERERPTASNLYAGFLPQDHLRVAGFNDGEEDEDEDYDEEAERAAKEAAEKAQQLGLVVKDATAKKKKEPRHMNVLAFTGMFQKKRKADSEELQEKKRRLVLESSKKLYPTLECAKSLATEFHFSGDAEKDLQKRFREANGFKKEEKPVPKMFFSAGASSSSAGNKKAAPAVGTSGQQGSSAGSSSCTAKAVSSTTGSGAASKSASSSSPQRIRNLAASSLFGPASLRNNARRKMMKFYAQNALRTMEREQEEAAAKVAKLQNNRPKRSPIIPAVGTEQLLHLGQHQDHNSFGPKSCTGSSTVPDESRRRTAWLREKRQLDLLDAEMYRSTGDDRRAPMLLCAFCWRDARCRSKVVDETVLTCSKNCAIALQLQWDPLGVQNDRYGGREANQALFKKYVEGNDL